MNLIIEILNKVLDEFQPPKNYFIKFRPEQLYCYEKSNLKGQLQYGDYMASALTLHTLTCCMVCHERCQSRCALQQLQSKGMGEEDRTAVFWGAKCQLRMGRRNITADASPFFNRPVTKVMSLPTTQLLPKPPGHVYWSEPVLQNKQQSKMQLNTIQLSRNNRTKPCLHLCSQTLPGDWVWYTASCKRYLSPEKKKKTTTSAQRLAMTSEMLPDLWTNDPTTT